MASQAKSAGAQGKTSKVCVFCEQGKSDEEVNGKLLSKAGVTAHYFCMLFSSGLSQNGKTEKQGVLGFLPEDIMKEVRRGLKLRCSYCRKHGATIGCIVRNCKKMFHLGCGRSNSSLHLFFETFSSFCPAHRPLQNVPVEDNPDALCSICMTGVTTAPSYESLRAPCCSNNWYHRNCVQRYATSAGLYFFKCPLCNNKDEFQHEMLSYGIYIPDQDASWETEPHAFQELLERYRHCDAQKCKCVEGRKYDKDGSKWEIILCDFCGSTASHVACKYMLKVKKRDICPDCYSIEQRANEEKKALKSPSGKKALKSPQPQLSCSPVNPKQGNPYPGPSNKMWKTGLPTNIAATDQKSPSTSQSLSRNSKNLPTMSPRMSLKSKHKSTTICSKNEHSKRKRTASPENIAHSPNKKKVRELQEESAVALKQGVNARNKKGKFTRLFPNVSSTSTAENEVFDEDLPLQKLKDVMVAKATSSSRRRDTLSNRNSLDRIWCSPSRKYKRRKNEQKLKRVFESSDASISASEATMSASEGEGASEATMSASEGEDAGDRETRRERNKDRKSSSPKKQYSVSVVREERGSQRLMEKRMSLGGSSSSWKKSSQHNKKRKCFENDRSQTTLTSWLKAGSRSQEKKIDGSNVTKPFHASAADTGEKAKQRKPRIIEWEGKQLLIKSPRVMLVKNMKYGKLKPRNLEIDMNDRKGNDHKPDSEWNSDLNLLTNLESDFRLTRNMIDTNVIKSEDAVLKAQTENLSAVNSTTKQKPKNLEIDMNDKIGCDFLTNVESDVRLTRNMIDANVIRSESINVESKSQTQKLSVMDSNTKQKPKNLEIDMNDKIGCDFLTNVESEVRLTRNMIDSNVIRSESINMESKSQTLKLSVLDSTTKQKPKNLEIGMNDKLVSDFVKESKSHTESLNIASNMTKLKPKKLEIDMNDKLDCDFLTNVDSDIRLTRNMIETTVVRSDNKYKDSESKSEKLTDVNGITKQKPEYLEIDISNKIRSDLTNSEGDFFLTKNMIDANTVRSDDAKVGSKSQTKEPGVVGSMTKLKPKSSDIETNDELDCDFLTKVHTLVDANFQNYHEHGNLVSEPKNMEENENMTKLESKSKNLEIITVININEELCDSPAKNLRNRIANANPYGPKADGKSFPSTPTRLTYEPSESFQLSQKFSIESQHTPTPQKQNLFSFDFYTKSDAKDDLVVCESLPNSHKETIRTPELRKRSPTKCAEKKEVTDVKIKNMQGNLESKLKTYILTKGERKEAFDVKTKNELSNVESKVRKPEPESAENIEVITCNINTKAVQCSLELNINTPVLRNRSPIKRAENKVVTNVKTDSMLGNMDSKRKTPEIRNKSPSEIEDNIESTDVKTTDEQCYVESKIRNRSPAKSAENRDAANAKIKDVQKPRAARNLERLKNYKPSSGQWCPISGNARQPQDSNYNENANGNNRSPGILTRNRRSQAEYQTTSADPNTGVVWKLDGTRQLVSNVGTSQLPNVAGNHLEMNTQASQKSGNQSVRQTRLTVKKTNVETQNGAKALCENTCPNPQGGLGNISLISDTTSIQKQETSMYKCLLADMTKTDCGGKEYAADQNEKSRTSASPKPQSNSNIAKVPTPIQVIQAPLSRSSSQSSASPDGCSMGSNIKPSYVTKLANLLTSHGDSTGSCADSTNLCAIKTSNSNSLQQNKDSTISNASSPSEKGFRTLKDKLLAYSISKRNLIKASKFSTITKAKVPSEETNKTVADKLLSYNISERDFMKNNVPSTRNLYAKSSAMTDKVSDKSLMSLYYSTADSETEKPTVCENGSGSSSSFDEDDIIELPELIAGTTSI